MKTALVGVLAALCLGAHCFPKDGCVPGATRCVRNAAEICDADGAYHMLADCDVVTEQSGAPFTCAFVDETGTEEPVSGHTCMPADVGGAGGEGNQ